MRKEAKRNIRQHSGNFQNRDIGVLVHWRFPGLDAFPVYPFAYEDTRRHERFVFREEFCRYMIVAFIEEGRLNYFCDGREYRLSAGDVIVIPPEHTYRFETVFPHFYRKKVVEFKGMNLLSFCETLGLNDVNVLPLEAPGMPLSLLERISVLIQSREQEDIPELIGVSHELLTRLSLLLHPSKKSFYLLNAVVERLEHHLDQPLQIRKLAEEFNISQTWLEKCFREKFRMTPYEYRQNCRMEQAKYLLTHTENSLKEISYRLGYCNPYYFSAEFRRLAGVPPSVFRKKISGTR